MLNTINYQGEGPLTKPFGESAPKIAPPATEYAGQGYLDGSTAKLEGANPGRDQDRSRMDERCEASYTYPGAAFGSGTEDADVDAGY